METVSATNEALTLFSTLREICRSVTRRIDNFRGNREHIEVLKDELSITEQKANVCRSTLEEYSSAIVTESLKFEMIDLKGMVQTIRRVEEKVVELEKKLPARKRVVKMFTRANRNAEEISQQVEILREMSSELKEMNEKLKGVGRRNDVFQPDLSTIPKLRVPVHLNFSSENTMEGKLKAEFLRSVGRPAHETRNVYSHVTAVVGISGMGGIGKTTALVGLAQDPDVQKAFSSGGIYFVVVGKDATPAKLVADLREIARRSGGERLSERIYNSGSLESAVSTISSWFSGREALFILDDLWQTSSNQLGYYEVLVGLLDNSPKSHILISTRSDTIACEASERVEFEPRESTGPDSRGMFLASAGLSETMPLESSCEELVRQVLELCSGIPLMLSIAGAQVRKHRGTTTASLKHLIHALDDKRLILPKERRGHYPACFNQAVSLSLETVGDVLKTSTKFMESWNEQSSYNPTSAEKRSVDDFVTECFRRLCILPRSPRVSKEVIFGIWGSIDKTMAWSIMDCLVDFHLVLEFKDGQGKSKFGLHDVILDYCGNVSQFGHNAAYKLYHREFLSFAWKHGHGELSSTPMPDTATADMSRDFDSALDEFWHLEACKSGRPWWKILSSSEELSGMEDYLLDNLFRHLTESDRIAEAFGLLAHMGWAILRVSRGGILALNADFTLVKDSILSHSRQQQDCQLCDDALNGIMDIWNMLKRAWPVIVNNSEALPTHAYGYLLDNKNNVPLIERYLQSALDVMTGPWLKPNYAFWYLLDSSISQRVFRLAEVISGVSVVNGGRMIIAATGSTLFWIDVTTMTATRERVIRGEKTSQSRIMALCVCERQGIVVLGFSTGELELRDERRGNLLLAISNAHEDQVRSVAISNDGRRVVSGSRDKTVRMWNAQTGAQLCEPFLGHEGAVYGVAISKDGRTVVSGSRDKTVRLWDAQTALPIGEPLCGHEDSVWTVAISDDGRKVVSGSLDTTARLWDTQTGAQICEPLRGHQDEVYSVAMSEEGRTVVSGSYDMTVRLWDAQTGAQIGEPLHGHEDTIWSVAISKDGRTVVTGSYDMTVRLWDTLTGAYVQKKYLGHGHLVNSVAISKDRRKVVTASLDSTLRLWNAQTGAQVGDPFSGHDKSVRSVAYSEDGKMIVSGSEDETVRLWDVETRTQIGYPFRGHVGKVMCVAISKDGRKVVSGSGDEVRLYDTLNRAIIGGALRGHEDIVLSVAISEDGRMVVSGSEDKTVRLWDVQTGTQIGEPLCGHTDRVMSVAISGDGRIVVSGSRDKAVRVWDTQTEAPIGDVLLGHEDVVYSVAISKDGRMVMSRSMDGTVVLWSRSLSGTHWKRSCFCSIPASLGFCASFVEGDQSSGEAGKLVCPLLGGVVVFELVQP